MQWKKLCRTGCFPVNDTLFENKLKKLFEEFDKDGDKGIDSEELGLLFASLGYVLPKQKLMVMIAEQDKDGDGKIGFEDMKKMFRLHQVVEANEDLTGTALTRILTDPAPGKKTV